MSAFKWWERDGVIVVSFTAGILDKAEIQQIEKAVMALVAAASANKRMLLNFKRVQFMSSGMIGMLVLLNKKAQSEDIDLMVCNVSQNVREVFKITRLNKVFKILDDDDPGTAGSLARLIRPPDNEGGHALPESGDNET